MNILEHKLQTGQTVADAILQPVLGSNGLARVVDVGARNGMFRLPAAYTRHCELVGFEPNPDEFRKLKQGTTDAECFGIHEPEFAEKRYFDCALWEDEVERALYVTNGPGATTLMGQASPEVTGRMYQSYAKTDPRLGRSFHDLHVSVIKTVNVACNKLDNLLPDDEIIDFLKIDAEGAELRILKGAEKIISARLPLFIYTEFVAFPYYQEHPVLGDLQVFLCDHGYRLIGLELGHAGYTRNPLHLGLATDKSLLHAGDAIFMLDPDQDIGAERCQRLAAIAMAFDFNSLALSLLVETGLTPRETVAEIEAALRRTRWTRRLRREWDKFPVRIYEMLKRMSRFMPRRWI